jgi:hypothetical protein
MSITNFTPWIGSYYENGINNKKTIILGEAHYLKDVENNNWNLPENKPKFTKACISAQIGIDDGDGKWTHPFFTKIVSAITGITKPNNEQKAEFWNSVIFMNYIQEFVDGGARKRPTKDQWEQAVSNFQNTIKIYKPENVFVFGYDLWDHISKYLNNTVIEQVKFSGKKRSTNSHFISDDEKYSFNVLPFYHPSSRFSPKQWHIIHNEFIDATL